MSTLKLVLASASPRRAELLSEAGYAFDIEPADVDEQGLAQGIEPRELARHLALAKADVVAGRHRGKPVIVLAADTICRGPAGEVIGKPVDRDDARRILKSLVGTLHGVVTGYAIVRCDDGRRFDGIVRSDIVMRDVSDTELDAFLDTGLWQGKAGAYGIQDTPGGDDPFVEEIIGELSNVVGLPMPQIVEALDELGVTRDS
ncbi:MAG: nucleoside triphosphate pyrophosphatase [Planctomycetota bacterium]